MSSNTATHDWIGSPSPSYSNQLHADEQTHFLIVGYALWLFGFTGSHRFYYGKPITGTIWFFTLGLFFVGWVIDLILIPRMQAQAEMQSVPGPVNHTVAWLLLTFLGFFGVHRFYMGKWITGLLYAATGGLFMVGYFYDMLTLNELVDQANSLPR